MSLDQYGRPERYDPELEQAKGEVLRQIAFDDFVESAYRERRQRTQQRVPVLIEKGRKAASAGSYGEAVALLRKAYDRDQDSRTLRLLISTYTAWGHALLSNGEWKQARQKLFALKRQGLISGGLYYMLARTNYVAFEKEGSIPTEYLKEALEAIRQALIEEPYNGDYHAEAARINATYALWWKSAPAGARQVQEYLDKTIEHMTRACVAAPDDEDVLQALREVGAIIFRIGDPTEILPVHLLQTLQL